MVSTWLILGAISQRVRVFLFSSCDWGALLFKFIYLPFNYVYMCVGGYAMGTGA